MRPLYFWYSISNSHNQWIPVVRDITSLRQKRSFFKAREVGIPGVLIMGFLKRLRHSQAWKRMFYERLSEPIHLNIISMFVWLFGSYRKKCEYDLVLRSHHAYALYMAADRAITHNKKRVTIVEFGVSTGAGLMNMQKIAENITKDTGIEFDIYGFDTGDGMPPPISYKDHPDLYQEGDFPMDFDKLQRELHSNTTLVIGEIAETLPKFCEQDFSSSPIAFLSIDVDYYSSTVAALKVLDMEADQYLPMVVVYLDDVEDPLHNSWCGELAAVNEFTDEHVYRKIERHTFLRGYRIFKNARWIDHIFFAHILDHPHRSDLTSTRANIILDNPHIR